MPPIPREEVTLHWGSGLLRRRRRPRLFLNVAQLGVNAVDLRQDRLCLCLAARVVDVWKPHEALLSCPKTNDSIIISAWAAGLSP